MTTNMTPDPQRTDRDLVAKTLLDHRRYMQTFLVVKDKEARTVPFRLTPIQERVDREMARRNIYLKPRQVGMSTYHLARRVHRVCTIPNWTAVTVAHNSDTTELLFQKVQYFYNNLPAEVKPLTKYNNRRELYFPEINSRYVIFTAGSNSGIGRGETVNDLHASEVSRWANPEEIISGLMESATKDAFMDLESTARGAGGYFNTEYVDAKEGKNTYKAFFFPWWWTPEYRLTDEESLAFQVDPFAPYDEEERLLADRYGLDRRQINWRRWKKAGLKAMFPQEYPEDDATCFLTSGNLYLDRKNLALAQQIGPRDPAKVLDNGTLKIWEAPKEGHQYVIGADVAEGLDEGDFDAATVLDYETGNEVATLHGKWTPHDYAEKLARLGTIYNKGRLAVERNNHGHAVLAVLAYELDYKRLYKHRDYDQKGNERARPGWITSTKTKPIALSTLDQAIKDAPSTFRDAAFFNEAFTFVRHEDGKTGAIKGCYDDRIMARAIAQEIWKSHRPVKDYHVINLLDDDD